MLLKLSKEIAGCYRHAAECREKAKLTSDPISQQELFEMEQRWLFLARSYEFTVRLRDFAAENRPKRKKAPGTSVQRRDTGAREKH